MGGVNWNYFCRFAVILIHIPRIAGRYPAGDALRKGAHMSATHRLLSSLGLAALTWLANSSLVDAQPTSRQAANGTIREIPWNDMVDRVVTLDGVPWGVFSKGLGQYVASPSQQVYLNSLARKPEEIEGRLVRVTGILRRHHMPAAPPGAQGYGQAFDYYSIDAFSVEVIEKVERDQLLPVTEDWIYVGMDEEKALDLIASRKFPETGLAMEFRPADVQPRPFLVEQDLALVLLLREKKVSSLMTVKLGKSKVEHKSDFVEAYRLAPLTEQDSVPAKVSKD